MTNKQLTPEQHFEQAKRLDAIIFELIEKYHYKAEHHQTLMEMCNLLKERSEDHLKEMEKAA